MPYIPKTQRDFPDGTIMSAGQLNYYFTAGLMAYLEQHGEAYQTYNDILGALEAAKLELYRRKISIYENKKMKENGDVY